MMRVQLDHIEVRAIVDMPEVPRIGECIEWNGRAFRVRDVVWFFDDGQPVHIHIILRSTSDQ